MFYENIAFGLRIKRCLRILLNKRLKNVVISWIRWLFQRDVTLLSGGQQQRVAIAKSFSQ